MDINGVATGVVRARNCTRSRAEFASLKIGDEVEATVVEQENENGEMELSFRAAGHQLVWQRMAKYMADGTDIASQK